MKLIYVVWKKSTYVIKKYFAVTVPLFLCHKYINGTQNQLAFYANGSPVFPINIYIYIYIFLYITL